MQKKALLIGALVAVTLIAGLLWNQQSKKSSPPPQIHPADSAAAFLTPIFKSRLDTPKEYRDISEHLPEFFTPEAVALIEENWDFCKRMGGSDICGYGADQDFLLGTQDQDDGLNFESSGFTAQEISPGLVEASFMVFPVSAPDDKTKIRYQMMKTEHGWRVNDIFHSDEKGDWPKSRSMRHQIAEENKFYIERASHLGGLFDNVTMILGISPLQIDVFATLFHFPLKICQTDGKTCDDVSVNSPRFSDLLKLCTKKESENCPLKPLMDENYVSDLKDRTGHDGDQARKDGWEFQFLDQSWLITKMPAPSL